MIKIAVPFDDIYGLIRRGVEVEHVSMAAQGRSVSVRLAGLSLPVGRHDVDVVLDVGVRDGQIELDLKKIQTGGALGLIGSSLFSVFGGDVRKTVLDLAAKQKRVRKLIDDGVLSIDLSGNSRRIWVPVDRLIGNAGLPLTLSGCSLDDEAVKLMVEPV